MIKYCTGLFLILLFASSCSYLPELPEIAGVTITEERDVIVIKPESGIPGSTGLLFYPGGLVDPHAYISIMAQFAKSGNGHTVAIVKEPANLAVLNANKGISVIRDITYVDDWVIAGHSLGGTMSCTTIQKEKNVFKGLILLAAYPSDNTNLSSAFIPVLSMYGSNDGLVTQSDIDAAANLLPKGIIINDIDSMLMYPGATYYHVITGGIHAYFGDYGSQNGDGNATITREEQQAETIEYMQKFFDVNNFN